MYVVAKLIDYDSMHEGNELKLLVPNVNLKEPIVAKKIIECGIWLIMAVR